MRCPNCGESARRGAKFCSNCGSSLGGVAEGQMADSGLARPFIPFVLSVASVVGMIAVAISMAILDDAPRAVGSPTAGLFRADGALQAVLGFGVLASAIFLMTDTDYRSWGAVIAALGLVSIALLLAVVLGGTFAAIFLALPGALAVGAGLLARRAAATT